MNSYQCLELDPNTHSIQVVHRHFPKLASNEVLVQVTASPINPSDRLFCQGIYGSPATNKIVPGFEGTGLVVEVGSGFLAKRLKGKRVAGAIQGRDGFWSQYVVLPASQCLALDSRITEEAGACAFVNPLTALALVEPLQKRQFSSLVQTAAASQLGRMIERWCRRHRIPLINIVHRSELKDLLIKEGFTNVLDSSDRDFQINFKDLSHKMDCHYAIDAVAGKSTGFLAKNLPDSSRVVVYGVLSGEQCQVDPADLIFRNISVVGFWLSHWMRKKNPFQLVKVFSDLKKALVEESVTTVSRRIKLEDVPQEIQNPAGSSSYGKILITPQ
jgi:NADPH:quinone reductase-like Zn-dependent oxidoreductase